MTSYTLALVGHGFMAAAILKGILDGGVIPPEKILVVNAHNPAGAAAFAEERGVRTGGAEALSEAEAVLLAFKPQQFTAAMPVYGPYIGAGRLVISILAGVELRDLAAALPEAAVLRAMPNLGLSVGLGATGYTPGPGVTPEQEALAARIFSAAGVAKKVTEEGLSAVTALSGSGPAYFFYLAEAMIAAAVEAGMDRESAEALCKQTMRGAAALWGAEEVPPETLRARVTSKKGTTDAAIRTMEREGLPAAVAAGMKACMERGKEMRKEFLGISN